jgi:hypothetical protein
LDVDSSILLERELFIAGTGTLDDIDINEISSIDVSLTGRRKNVLNKLESLLT